MTRFDGILSPSMDCESPLSLSSVCHEPVSRGGMVDGLAQSLVMQVRIYVRGLSRVKQHRMEAVSQCPCPGTFDIVLYFFYQGNKRELRL